MYSDPIRGSSHSSRYWALAATGEATPDVMSALCWSVWSEGVELGARTAMNELGILPWSQVRRPADPDEALTACFFGRQALNVDLVREILGAMPDGSADDFERELVGTVRPDAPAVRTARSAAVALKAPRAVRRFRGRPRRLYEDQIKWWREHVLDVPTDDPLALLADAALRFRVVMRAHVHVRALLTVSRSRVIDLAGSVDRTDLLGPLLGGHGDIVETLLAEDLWQLGRDELPLPEFLRRHGFHGPREGDPISRSWREDADAVVGLATATAGRPDEQLPRRREAEAVSRRSSAETSLLAAVSLRHRRAAAQRLSALGDLVRSLELTKAALLMAIDGCRAAVRLHGAALVESGTLDSTDDAFHFTKDELLKGVGEDAREVAAFRSSRREDYRVLDLPAVFTGAPEPVSAAIRPSSDALVGTAGSPGVVEGPVRIVTDPASSKPLSDGEILVCRVADPGWTPLFTLAAGVVVDLAGPGSHALIVARELGIAGVFGTGSAARALSDGDLVRLDGDVGTVVRL